MEKCLWGKIPKKAIPLRVQINLSILFNSCKSKGTPFLSNTPFGNFLDLAREAFGVSAKRTLTTAHKLLTILERDDVQSKTFELCGQKEPHLVKYDFDLDLKPLFHTFTDGSIAPSMGELKETDFGPIAYDTEKIVQICKEYQAKGTTQHHFLKGK